MPYGTCSVAQCLQCVFDRDCLSLQLVFEVLSTVTLEKITGTNLEVAGQGFCCGDMDCFFKDKTLNSFYQDNNKLVICLLTFRNLYGGFYCKPVQTFVFVVQQHKYLIYQLIHKQWKH